MSERSMIREGDRAPEGGANCMFRCPEWCAECAEIENERLAPATGEDVRDRVLALIESAIDWIYDEETDSTLSDESDRRKAVAELREAAALLRGNDTHHDSEGESWDYEICKACNRPNKIGFSVSEDDWAAIVPEHLRQRVVCYSCFENFATAAGRGFTLLGLYPVTRVSGSAEFVPYHPPRPRGEGAGVVAAASAYLRALDTYRKECRDREIPLAEYAYDEFRRLAEPLAEAEERLRAALRSEAQGEDRWEDVVFGPITEAYNEAHAALRSEAQGDGPVGAVCANCGDPNAAIAGGELDPDEAFCSVECYEQLRELGCPQEHGGDYRPKAARRGEGGGDGE